jgi:RNA recognition motif-containing protein
MSSSASSNSLSNITETKLYVTNLPDNCNHAELKSLFQQFGNVLECVVMWNHYAFIHYADLNEARIGLVNLHGYLFYGKNLIVQFSTSSNRPLPKCKAFENKPQQQQQQRQVNDRNYNEKQNGLDFIKNYENFVCQVDTQKQKTPATILCYRASDLEKNEFGVTHNNNNNKIEKDWIKILSSTNICKEENEEEEEEEEEVISLSDIPTPDTPFLSNKMPFIPKLCEIPRLDQIPTPPLPTEVIITSSSSSGGKAHSSDSSSSADLSDYPISSSNSVSPYTLSLDEDTEDIFESSNITTTINKTCEIENFNLFKKYSRSRCLLINSILFPELKEKFYLN